MLASTFSSVSECVSGTMALDKRGMSMSQAAEEEMQETQLPKELLISFARFLASDIIGFYQSEEGKAYYAEWLKSHPEYQ